MAEDFAAFFKKKVDDVRAATADCPPPHIAESAPAMLPSFRYCTPAEVRRVIMRSPVKSCTLDPVPTFLIRQLIDVLLPFLTALVNASLTQGRLPIS
jgi:hypothetical protein